MSEAIRLLKQPEIPIGSGERIDNDFITKHPKTIKRYKLHNLVIVRSASPNSAHFFRTQKTEMAYKLELPEELRNIHSTFHVSNLKKCLSDESLVIPMKELQLDDKLNFVEEPVEIMDREVKQLKKSRIPIVKVRWNSKRGPKFMWTTRRSNSCQVSTSVFKHHSGI
ncbi:hypothetical protein Tco_0413382 [Tanacetum coccineum]